MKTYFDKFGKWSVTVLITFLLMGCGQGYLAEKLFWQAGKTSASIWANPKEARVEDYQNAIKAYQKVVEKCPATKIAGKAQFMIGKLYEVKGDFDTSREEYAKVTVNYFKHQDLSSEAQFAIAQLYERERNWDKAKEEYEKVTTYYPLASRGLEVPLYIAERYSRLGEKELAEKAYEKAIKGYRKLINEIAPASPGVLPQSFLALAYQSQGRWSEAIEAWQTLSDTYPNSPQAASSLFMIGRIYQDCLQEEESAVESYRKFLSVYPEHPLAKAAQEQIESLAPASVTDETTGDF